MANLSPEIMGILAAAGLALAFLLGIAVFATKIYKRVDQGQALIVNTPSKTKVTFHGAFVVPVFYRAEYMDISLKTIEIDRRGKEGLICNDNIRADIKVTFFVRVNPTEEAVRKVAESVGCARASDPATLEELFQAKFSEALKTVGKQLEFEQLYTQRDDFRDRILKSIGDDLNGYSLEDAAIDYLEQTPVSDLDHHNILDARGIEKITKLTEDKRVETTKLRNKAKKDVELDNLETKKALFRYEKEEAEEAAEKAKAIAVVQAQKAAEAEKIRAEELAKQETARLEAAEKVKVREIGKTRTEELAQKDRERALLVETEKVERDRQIEAIAREREITLQRIAKDKEVEVERKEIAEIVRDRVAVDKTVTEEEERIKDLRVVMEAERAKKAGVIGAEAEAQQRLIADIKAAEAAEAAAQHKAKQRLVEADAELEAADRLAKAKIRLAEGIQAEHAATGLAEAKVKEASASANEKQGLVEAKVLREKLSAEAAGIEAKADAMKKLDGVSREHEEFRLHLEHDRLLSMERIKSSIKIAEAQAMAMAEAFKAAKINIVGGDGEFYDNFIKSVSVGNVVEGFVDHSPTAKALLERITNAAADAVKPKEANGHANGAPKGIVTLEAPKAPEGGA